MFFLLDKPYGISSHAAIRRFARDIGEKKIGHTGTLDPLATGLLLVATGNSTKLISYIPHTEKTYECEIQLDGSTESGDLGTAVIPIDPTTLKAIRMQISRASIQSIASEQFVGDVTQIPPAHSALRVDGERAYIRKRRGEHVSMSARCVHIREFHIVCYDFPTVRARMIVSSGTYVRSLARDLGHALGLGWYLKSLRRTAIGLLSEWYLGDMRSVGEIGYKALPLSAVFPDIDRIDIDDEQMHMLENGISIPNRFSLSDGALVFAEHRWYVKSLLRARTGVLSVERNNICESPVDRDEASYGGGLCIDGDLERE